MQETQQNSSIQPRKLANKEGEVKFHWAVSQLERLSDMLYSDAGAVDVSIEAYFDHRKRCLLNTKIKANLTLECQTSFEPIDYQVDSETIYCTVVEESQFANVEEEFEAVIVEDGFLDVKQMIEDELILSVPLVANKSADDLEQEMSFGVLDEVQIAKDEEANNPFSVLKHLKD